MRCEARTVVKWFPLERLTNFPVVRPVILMSSWRWGSFLGVLSRFFELALFAGDSTFTSDGTK
jgi:hypothetical protein